MTSAGRGGGLSSADVLRKSSSDLDLGIHLYVKVPRLGDSDGTFLRVFESSCHLLLPI